MDKNDRINQLKELVRQFAGNIDVYKVGNYDEANTRVDYIDKFFALLGWDIANNSKRIEKREERRNLTAEYTEFHGGCCFRFFLLLSVLCASVRNSFLFQSLW